MKVSFMSCIFRKCIFVCNHSLGYFDKLGSKIITSLILHYLCMNHREPLKLQATRIFHSKEIFLLSIG